MLSSMTLADFWRRTRFDAADAAAGLARDYFLAEAVYFAASRSAGHSESEWSVADVGDGTVRLDAIIPAKFRSSVVPISRVVSNPAWESGRLASFDLDGRRLTDTVRVLRCEGAVGWVRQSLSATSSIVAVASVPVPRPTGKPRSGRRIEADAQWTAQGQHGILVGSPGIWRVRGGWIGGLRHERDATLSPNEVTTISIRDEGVAPLELQALPPGSSSGIPVRASTERGRDELEALVDAMLPTADLELRFRVVASARALLDVADLTGAPPSQAALESAVRSAIVLQNADDADATTNPEARGFP
jgi:hypothetical protein